MRPLARLVGWWVYGPGARAGSAWRKRWARLRNPRATIAFGPGTHVGPGFLLHMPRGGSFTCGARVEFRRDFRAEIGPGGRVSIGDDCRFTYGCVIQCSSEIEILDRSILGQEAMVVDGNHRFRDPCVPFLAQGLDLRPVRIGPEAIVHSKVTITNSIGERAIVGANAVVTSELPGWTVCGGVPARVLETYR